MLKIAAVLGVGAIIGLTLIGLAGCGGGDSLANQRQQVDIAMTSGEEGVSLDMADVLLCGSVTRGGITLTSSGMVWDPVNYFLTGNVTITNKTGQTMFNTVVTIPTITPASVLSYDPYEYGTISNGATSAAQQWTFFNLTSVGFKFIARVSYSTTP